MDQSGMSPENAALARARKREDDAHERIAQLEAQLAEAADHIAEIESALRHYACEGTERCQCVDGRSDKTCGDIAYQALNRAARKAA